MNNEKTQLQRVNINLPTSLVEKVKEYANQLGVNTTSAYIFLLNQALNQKDSIAGLSILAELSKKIELDKDNED